MGEIYIYSFAGFFPGVVTDLATTLLYIKTVALVVHVLFFNLGYGALVFHIIPEILPLQNRYAWVIKRSRLFHSQNATKFLMCLVY